MIGGAEIDHDMVQVLVLAYYQIEWYLLRPCRIIQRLQTSILNLVGSGI